MAHEAILAIMGKARDDGSRIAGIRVLLLWSTRCHRMVPPPRRERSFDEARFYVRSHVDRARDQDEYRHEEGDQDAGHKTQRHLPFVLHSLHSISFHWRFTGRAGRERAIISW